MNYGHWAIVPLEAPLYPLAPGRIWKWRAPRKWGEGADSAQSTGNCFLVVPLRFGFNSTISSFDERFRDGQYSLLSFSFAVLLQTVPPGSAICKSGAARTPVPYGIGASGYILFSGFIVTCGSCNY